MIVSCGEALVDVTPEPVPGGGPMNVAVAAARLGAPSAFLGLISSDGDGDTIWAHLEANGVDLRVAGRVDQPTARAVVEHTPQPRFRFEGDDTADMQLTRADLSPLGGSSHIVHGGTLGMFRGATASTLADLVEAHEGLVSLDPNVRPQLVEERSRWDHYHRRWVACASIYKASDEDLAWIWPGRSSESCAAELLAGAVRVVLVTRGADGATVYLPDEEVHIPGEQVTLVDTVGAGDTFVAAVLTALWGLECRHRPEDLERLEVSDWEAIAGYAGRAAAITCSRPGADPPRSADLPPDDVSRWM